MPRKSDRIPINDKTKDKRVKLTEEQRESIREEYKLGTISTRALAEKYGVSRRTIQFVIDPEKLKRNKQLFAERQKDGRYYDKDKHREYMKKHRDYKKYLYSKGDLKE